MAYVALTDKYSLFESQWL